MERLLSIQYMKMLFKIMLQNENIHIKIMLQIIDTHQILTVCNIVCKYTPSARCVHANTQ